MLKFVILLLFLNYSFSLEKSTNSRGKPWAVEDAWNMTRMRSNRAKSVSCGTHPITAESSYSISTPYYYFPIPSAFECTWKFYGSKCKPVISCPTFNLDESSECKDSHLEITDDVSVSKKFCGNDGPQNVTTNSTILVANFPLSFLVPRPSVQGFECMITCVADTEGLNVITDPVPSPPTANCSCGIPGETTENDVQAHRIVGGRDAPPNFWKWHVGLVLKSRTSPFCGGALINDRFVLTAAHCLVMTRLVDFPFAADVLLNAYNLTDSSEPAIRRGIVRVIPHPFYDVFGQDYDYGLVEFSEPVDLTRTEEPMVTPVCLPPRGTEDTYEGRVGTVTGWGVTTEGGDQPEILQEAEIPIISNVQCSENYGNGTQQIAITDRMLCAAYEEGGVDSCQGDSGGPFFLQMDDGRYIEIGVVSFGEGCARKGKPGVYARVTEVNDWIRSVAKGGTYCNA